MTTPTAAEDLVVATDAAQDEEQQAALAHGVEPAEDGDDENRDPDMLFTAAAGAGVRGSLGRVYTRGVDPGWYGRLELAAYSASAFEGAGAIAGALIGGEFWSAPGARGGGLPMGFYLGARSPHVMSTLGGGFQMFIVDDVDDDGGFGVYVPYASFTLGVEAAGMRVLAEGRAQFRWQWGADDRGQLQFGLSIAHVWESSVKSRRQGRPRSRGPAVAKDARCRGLP